MTPILETLLDLDSLHLGGEGVRFGFERPIPAWAWPAVTFIAVMLAAWSYQRLDGSKVVRGVLAACRALVLLLLVVLAAGPQLVKRTETVERDWVLVLVDRSASLTIEDVAGDEGSARVSREQQLRAMLEATWPQWNELANNRTLVWLGFDSGAYDLKSAGAETTGRDDGATLALEEPDGQRTSIATAVEQALARAAARPLSAIVLVSDGRSVDEPTRAALRRLQAERAPVHAIALGSDDEIGDIAVRRVDAPQTAFVDDIAPVRVHLDRLGTAGAPGATVRLIDLATQVVMDERRVAFDSAEEGAGETERTITLVSSPDEAGSRQWMVEVEPDGADLISQNNTRRFTIDLVDRPLRALYVDGYPRWEQRYLRNMLLREKSITSSSLILSPTRRYTQEGDVELDALPDSPEQWAEFDVVILGDVHPDVFTDDQLVHLRDHIALRGAGLIWIAGAGSMPMEWKNNPLEDLLPFARDAVDGSTLDEPSVMAPAPAADRLAVLRLRDDPEQPWPAQLADPSTGWSLLRWVQRIDRSALKPTAEVIATSNLAYSAEQYPVVLTMRYGAGRALYVATDEIWRWRYAQGELLEERFWLQMVRMLGRESLSRSGAQAVLEVSPRRSVVNQPVRVSVELLDQSAIELELPSIPVELTRAPEPGERSDSPRRVELVLRPEDGKFRRYAAIWLPDESGSWDVRSVEPMLSSMALHAEAEVALPDDELRHPETDHEALARLTEATGGRVFAPAEASSLFTNPEYLPRRRVVLWNDQTETLWDTPLALIAIVTLLTIEWVARRVIRLI